MLERALLDFMAERPLSDIGVSGLCWRAEVNRSTFYRHCGNPADVFREIEDRAAGEIVSALHEASAGTGLSLGLRVETICRYFQDRPPLAHALFAYPNEPSHLIAALFEESTLPASTKDVQRLFVSEVPTDRLLATFLMQGIYSLIRQWIADGEPISPEELGRLSEKIAFEGWASVLR